MAYSFQTFSIGQVLTAAQMNQVEASIRDHAHGTAGVSGLSTFSFTSADLRTALSDETGTGVAVFGTSPVFTTQITTPKIVTASTTLDLIPAAVSTVKTVNIGDSTAGEDTYLVVNGGTNAAKGSGITLQTGGVRYAGIYHEGLHTGSGTSQVPCFFAATGLGMKWMVNGSTAASMTLSSAGVLSTTNAVLTTPNIGTPSAGVLTNCSGTASSLVAGNATQAGGFTPSQSPGANNILVYNSSAVLAAGTVPLARMGAVVATGSSSMGTGTTVTATLAATGQYFYLLSCYASDNSPVRQGGYATEVSFASIKASDNVSPGNDVLEITNNSGGTHTFYYKAYKLTET